MPPRRWQRCHQKMAEMPPKKWQRCHQKNGRDATKKIKDMPQYFYEMQKMADAHQILLIT